MKNCIHITALILLVLGLPGAVGCKKQNGASIGAGGKQATSRVEALRQAGEPVSLAELNAWYAEPLDNAAPLYEQAFASLSATDPKSPSFLDKNQQALGLLHQAAEKSQCRYSMDLRDGASTQLPHLAKLKTCAQLLNQAAVANAAKGKPEVAAQCVLDGLQLSGSLEQEPLLISQLVRLSSDSIAVAGLETALSAKVFPAEPLLRLQAAFRKREQTVQTALARAYVGERCEVLSLFQMPIADYEKVCAGGGSNMLFGTAAEFDQYRRSAIGQADLTLALDYFSNWLAIVSQPFPDALAAAEQWGGQAKTLLSDAKGKGYRVCPLMLPALNVSLERQADAVAHIRIAATALALERYRASMNSLPDSLGLLAPKYLPAIPDDPYDGKPVKYKKLSPKGYVVYSVGRNRRDDGGAAKPASAQADGPYDLTFSVRR